MAGRLAFVSATLFAVFAATAGVARGEGKYQSTRDDKTLVWNSDAKPGDVATWSGDRDRKDYAKGFGRLVWYTSGVDRPELYARYWGRMLNGKFEGPVNVHAKKKTHYAIFIDGIRVTRWTPGTAPLGATARWQTMVAKKRSRIESAGERASAFAKAPDATSHRDKREPEAPAAGPGEEKAEGGRMKAETRESIPDIYNERWPKIDIDDSLRLLAFPPRRLR